MIPIDKIQRLFAAMGPQAAFAIGLALIVLAGFGRGRSRFSKALGVLTLLAGVVLVLPRARPAPAAGALLAPDGFSIAWQILFYVGALPFAILGAAGTEAPVLLYLGSALGMGIIALSRDLLMLFIGLELMSIPAYLLVMGLGRRERAASEAALKYFFCGGAASALFLLGIALYYARMKTLAFAPGVAPADPIVGASLALMGTAALFKIGAVPLHFWLPDVYEASSPELAGFFSTALKAAAVLLLMRVVSIAPASALAKALPWAGALTMFVGAVLALGQTSLQRLLSYSSIAHAGNIILGVGAWAAMGASPAAAYAVYFYLAAYLFMNNGAFSFLAVSGLKTREDLKGFAKASPVLAGLFAVFMLALGGAPPTAGFLAKLLIFWEALKAGLYAPLAVALLSALIALVYYLALVRDAYFEEGSAAPVQGSWVGRAVLWACAAPSAALGLFPIVLGPIQRLLGL